MLDFQEKLKAYILLVDEQLEKSVPQKENIQYEIYQAMRYSLFAGGKRLRPVLTLAACEAEGGDVEDALPFAAALEMIHTYSLIHDDLPAMDDDHLRRGKPTNHIKFGEAMAILAGDALLTRAFEVMAEAAVASKNPINALKAMQVIVEASGTEGMLGGQVVDIIADGKKVDEAYLRYMHARKTGALITASVLAGAIISGASEERQKAYREYGEKLGLAFQIQDDILDIEGDEITLGKPIGSDKENEKTTFVTLLGAEPSKQMVKQLTVQSVGALEDISTRSPFLQELAKYLLGRQN